MERYKQECQKISQQINPSDEFIQDLKANLGKRVTQEKLKRKNYFSKVAMIFFALTLISSGAFAMDFGDWLMRIFSNTDETMQVAIENGYVQNVDMDYIENDGIAIKVNSLIIDDNKMNIVFDVKGEINGDLLINKFYLTSNSEYTEANLKELNTLYNREFKTIDKNSHLLIIKMSNIENKFYCNQNLNIVIDGLNILDDKENSNENKNIWSFNIKLNENNFNKDIFIASNYIIENNDYIERFEINVTSTGTNIKIDLKDNFDKYSFLNKENIYIQTENGKKYVCRELVKTNKNFIQINLPITIYDNIEKFDIILNLENENIILKVKKENS